MVLFFSKLNLVSGHVFKVYEDQTLLPKILHIMLGDLSQEVAYSKQRIYMDEAGVYTDVIDYKLGITSKTAEFLYGHIYKKSKVFYNSFDSDKKELVRNSVNNTEAIKFYFDLSSEMIGFHTTNRFGYKEFNEAFEGIVNNCMEKNKREYRFSVSLISEGMNLDDIKIHLKSIKQIQQLSIKIQPPNPDSEIIENLQKDGENLVEMLKSGKITSASYIFSSKGTSGLDIESPVVEECIKQVEEINAVVGKNKVYTRGYVAVEAIGKDGKKYTTSESRPVRKTIGMFEDFIEACKDMINSLL